MDPTVRFQESLRSLAVDGRPEGSYTDAFEIICCDCGDDPGRDDS